MGAEEVDPPTTNVSVQVPTVGWAVVKETKSKLKRNINCFFPFGISACNFESYRTWQMGVLICSTNLASIRTVNAQVEGELTAVDGDCQYVLFRVTVPPQVVIASVHQKIKPNISFHN